MGGNRVVRASDTRLRVASALVGLAVIGLAATACDDDEPTTSGEVEAAAALTAIVEWQAGEQEPVMNDNGEERLPVIYVVAADGETIDVGVQADVAAATVDIADVRFADESADAFDDGVDDEPVIADGVMLLIGALPDPAPSSTSTSFATTPWRARHRSRCRSAPTRPQRSRVASASPRSRR